MMKKTRIIREEFSNGDIQYRVQKKWFFNLFWTTDMFYDAEHDMWFESIFNTFEEAIQSINCIKPKVISQEIIYETE